MILAIITLIGASIGGIIGGLFTFFGVKITINDSKKQHDLENKKTVLPLLKLKQVEYEYNYKYIEFDFYYTAESKDRERKNLYHTPVISFSINNIGERELYDLYISDIGSTYFFSEHDSHSIAPIIYKDDKININFLIYEHGKYDNDTLPNEIFDTIVSPICFSCYYKDCYNNWYYQKFEIRLFHSLESNVPEDECALNVSIEDFNILSAPIEISKEELPWNKEKDKKCSCY